MSITKSNPRMLDGIGTSANNLVQLDANAKLPAVDGSQLTNVGVSYSTSTFTPTWDGYPSPHSTSGSYIKIGNNVTVQLELVTGSATDTSTIKVTNLPFAISGKVGGGMVFHNNTGLYAFNLLTFFTENSTTCELFTVNGGAQVGIKYVDSSQPTLGGFSTLNWTLVYPTA